MILENLYTLGVLSVADWLVATTISRARVLREVRVWVAKKSAYVGEGISCQYCISHWVGFALIWLAKPRLITTEWLIADYAISWAAIVGVGALIARNWGQSPPNGIHPDCAALMQKEDELEKMVK